MKLPSDVNEDEFLLAFQNVVAKVAHRYTFASYEVEDIQQEAFLIAVKSLKDYDRKRSLENFLYVHISNRLKNFKRDNYYRLEVGRAETIQDSKRNILEPLDVCEMFYLGTDEDVPHKAYLQEILERIDQDLPANMRSDYLKLKNRGKLSKSRKNRVIKKIQEIIEGNDAQG